MDSLGLLMWVCPLFTIGVAFLTSGIIRYKVQRYSILLVVLFVAFLFDLMSLSFKIEALDVVLLQLTLLVLADFFWRGIRKKNRVLRIGSLVIGLFFFIFSYQDWIRGGYNRVYRFFDSTISSTSDSVRPGFYVKTRGILKIKSGGSDKIVLFKKSPLGVLEQKLAQYKIPEGYERSDFSYKWQLIDYRIAVQVIGDTDTLWTLTDPGPPK